MRFLLARVTLAAICCTASVAADADTLKALADSHQWFALRDAVRNIPRPPLLYQGAVACMFHDVRRCEADMRRVAHDRPAADRADAYGFLMLVHAMEGRFHRAMLDSEARRKASGTPGRPDGLHAMLSAFGQYPDLTVLSRRTSRVSYQRAAGHLLVPVTMNGGSARYILDTGANFSTITASEAKRLGLRTAEVHAPNLWDSTGAGFALGKVALADHMEVGNFRLKNVPFMVVEDDLDAFAELPEDARGALGMQVLLAFGILRWNRAGTIELGGRSEPAPPGSANLCFDGLMPLVTGSFNGARLVFFLDTGDSESRLYSRFEREFPTVVKEQGKPGAWTLSGAGGTVETPATILPELLLNVGGLAAPLRPVHIVAKGAGSESHHGVIGMDLLDQATEITIDFQAMRITLANR